MAFGIGLIAGLFVSDIAEQTGDLVGGAVDSVLGAFGLLGPPDAIITSGSDNVHIMGKPAARAAGVVDHDYLNTPQPEAPWYKQALRSTMYLAGQLLSLVELGLHPVDNAMAAGRAVQEHGSESVKSFGKSVWENFSQPVVEGATPGEKYSQHLYGYDAAGQVTKALHPQQEERFWYDPAGNRTDERRSPVWHNLLLRLNGLKLDYDGFGRLTQRRDKNGVAQQFRYDDEQRVSEILFTGHAEFTRAEYRYDPLGRRTHKLVWRHNDAQPETVRFDWQGLRLAGEQSERQPDRYVQYLYTEGSYEPLARVDSAGDDGELYWYHTELNGLPERVTDAQGQTVWRGHFSIWGETERETSVPQWHVPRTCVFRGSTWTATNLSATNLNTRSLAPPGRAKGKWRVMRPEIECLDSKTKTGL